MKVAIVGAGASGLFLGGLLSNSETEVTIFDGNEKCGKKIFITGKGRCNITNACDNETYLSNVVNGEKFMRSAISKFTAFDTINFFEEQGLAVKVERGNRVFPVSDKSSDVIKVLENYCRNAEIKLHEKVVAIKPQSDKFLVKTEKFSYTFDKVVIATGGKSYSATGSSGDGYKFAKMLGHNVVSLVPALVPIELKDKISDMQGLPLKNVTLYAVADGKKYSFFGEMLFTDIGITGPIVLTMSSYINRAKNVDLYVDFKPALSEEQLDARLLREFESGKNKNLFNILRTLFPKNFINYFLSKAELNEQRQANSITVIERRRLKTLIKHFPIAYKGVYPIDAGVVTSGGVDLKEVNPSSMESKIHKGLYFIGEVLDVDCLTGGFNLQIAFSTAYACGQAIIKEVKNV